MNLYHKILKDFKWLYKFLRFKRIMWIFKNTFKITRVGEKSDKKCCGLDKKSTTNIIFLIF